MPSFKSKIALAFVSVACVFSSLPVQAKPHNEKYTQDEKTFLLGIDDNRNGVRDSLEARFMEFHANKPLLVKAMTQMAKVVTASMLVDTAEQRAKLQPARDDALTCMIRMSGKYGVNSSAAMHFVLTSLLNTEERTAAYRRSETFDFGKSAKSSAVEPCEFDTTS